MGGPCPLGHTTPEASELFPPFLPALRFPMFLPRFPPDLQAAGPNMLFPPLHQPRAPAPAVFFTLADLDLCLFGSTGWLSSSCARTPNGVNRSYAFSGIRISQSRPGGQSMSSLCGEVMAAPGSVHSSTWRSTKSVPPVHELPTGLLLSQTGLSGLTHYAVFCGTHPIPKGTKFGPFKGRVVNPSEMKTFDDNGYMWEIFKEGRLSHFLDGRGNSGNWMSYVNCARTPTEQNLVAVQEGEVIFYEVNIPL
ncbi:PR domain zinc finger protein 14-like [Aplysia californica]|uniref:PR domain zinc finger protein 14-like n=1 Tax=Aplysia californica TaxID=6500 RepID=A0ABM0ZVF1_APLCA|nr:PR domain zinc finger protein 14-like [Aplysia californica]